jgi:hypothetical protein
MKQREGAGPAVSFTRKLAAAYSADPFRFIALCCLGFLAIVTTALLVLHTSFPLSKQPFPDAHEYLNAANRLAHGQGYTTTVRDNLYSPHIRQAANPPRFPPGTSLILAPFALIGSYPGNVEFGARLLVVALVVASGWAAYSLAGWYAALLTVLVTGTSEFVLVNTQIVMSDVLAALLIVICLPLMKLGTRWSVYLLGFVAGYGVVVRESGVVVVACVLIVMSGWDRLRVAVGAFPPVLGLAVYNWSTFGAPWRTGYSYWLGSFPEYAASYVFKHPWPGGEEIQYAFSLQFFHLLGHTHAGYFALLPNIWFYPLILLGFSTIFGPPWLTLLGLFATAWWWRLREARFTLLLAGLTVIVYMPNYDQTPRYLAGPCFLLTAWAMAAVVHVARRVRKSHGQQIANFLAPAPAKTAAQNQSA